MSPAADASGFDLTRTYIHLPDGGDARSLPLDEDFWKRIEQREELHEGRLMGAFRLTQDPSHWEMHPAGDEILYLLSGSMDVILETGDGKRVVALRGSGTCIVPRGIWHRQVVHGACEFVFITPGKNTQRRPIRTDTPAH